jgi:PIN domain nuclease of toxin-antitoxin system
MTHLLDTHVWIQRAFNEPMPILAEETLTRHADSLAISDISIWELAKLVEFGRVRLYVPLEDFIADAISPELTVLPINGAIAAKLTELECLGFHKDPADQLIVATALVHGLRLISNDTLIRQWGGVPMLWRSSRG